MKYSVFLSVTLKRDVLLLGLVLVGALFGDSLNAYAVGTPRNDVDQLTATRSAPQVNAPIVLRWRSADPAPVLLPLGKRVESTGSLTVKASRTTHYILLSTINRTTTMTSAKVEVLGLKGDDEIDPSRFRGKISFGSNQSLAELALKVHSVVQDELKFSVSWKTVSKQELQAVTNASERAELKKVGENKIGKRRLAYKIVLRENEGKTEVNISAVLEKMMLLEEVWRPEDSDSLLRQQVDSLREKLR